MPNEVIAAAVRLVRDTRAVTTGTGAIASVPLTFREWFGDSSAVVVADENTFRVAGQEVVDLLNRKGIRTRAPFVFPGFPVLRADFNCVLDLESSLRRHRAIPVAVGAGTINDITKLAAHRCDRPYMVVATAASMDGYTASGASITHDGFKRTDPCPGPRAVVGDLDVLCEAPLQLTASGYGDLVGKITAGGDWLIAEALGVETIPAEVWELVQASLRGWLADPLGLHAANLDAIARLFEGLVVTGLAIQCSGSSRPASGSEHVLSHLWEMEGLTFGGEPAPHGFKVALGSVAVAALYETILTRDFQGLDPDRICATWPTREELEALIRRDFGVGVLGDMAVEESLAKHPQPSELAKRLATLRECWPRLRSRLLGQLSSARELTANLSKAGCPTAPRDYGLSVDRIKSSFKRARHIRRRYTLIDLAVETGCLGDCLDVTFSSTRGIWTA